MGLVRSTRKAEELASAMEGVLPGAPRRSNVHPWTPKGKQDTTTVDYHFLDLSVAAILSVLMLLFREIVEYQGYFQCKQKSTISHIVIAINRRSSKRHSWIKFDDVALSRDCLPSWKDNNEVQVV